MNDTAKTTDINEEPMMKNGLCLLQSQHKYSSPERLL